jgi:flagellar hook-basal body complex protein FliE
VAIDPVTPSIAGLGPAGAAGKAAAAADGGSFGESLRNMLSGVDSATGEANAAVADMVENGGDVHKAMIALQRAEMTLQLTVQIRNKLVQAYQDVMRMPI